MPMPLRFSGAQLIPSLGLVFCLLFAADGIINAANEQAAVPGPISRSRLDDYVGMLGTGSLDLKGALEVIRNSGHDAMRYALPKIIPSLQGQTDKPQIVKFLRMILREVVDPLAPEERRTLQVLKDSSPDASIREIASEILSKQDELAKAIADGTVKVPIARSAEESKQAYDEALDQIRADGIYNTAALSNLASLGTTAVNESMPAVQPLLKLDLTGRPDVVFHELSYLNASGMVLPNTLMNDVSKCATQKFGDHWIVEMAKSVIVNQERMKAEETKPR